MAYSETVPCETCDTPTDYTGTKRCNNCREVEIRLRHYVRSKNGRDFIAKCLANLEEEIAHDRALSTPKAPR